MELQDWYGGCKKAWPADRLPFTDKSAPLIERICVLSTPREGPLSEYLTTEYLLVPSKSLLEAIERISMVRMDGSQMLLYCIASYGRLACDCTQDIWETCDIRSIIAGPAQ